MTKAPVTTVYAPELADVPAPSVTTVEPDTRTVEERASAMFPADVVNHQMTVLHDDGLYRHLRFRAPESSFSWFDLITWPGNLAIKGDHGGFMFARDRDMFEFFRRGRYQRGINPRYWAEKLPDHGISVREYSEDVLKANIEQRVKEYAEEEYPELLAEYEQAKARHDALPRLDQLLAHPPTEPISPDEIRELIAGYDDDGELGYEEDGRRLLSRLEGYRIVSDTWEWDLNDWDYHYIWCCHAIQWGIARYDDARAAATAAGGAA